jgi:hypothetical protein
MMKNFIAIFLCIFWSNMFPQQVSIDTLKISSLGLPIENNLFFPIVKSANAHVDSLINFDLLNVITSSDTEEGTAESKLLFWAEDIIQSLDFDVSCLSDSLLSIEVISEGCGAYCSQSHYYFNYDTRTGLPVTIYSIIDSTSEFQEVVRRDKNIVFLESKDELEWLLVSQEIDSTIYEWGLEYLVSWNKTVDLSCFKLYTDKIVIKDDCYFPHAIQCYSPVIELKYFFIKIDFMLLKRN